MKKILALILAAIMLLSVVACANDSENESESSSEAANESETVDTAISEVTVTPLDALTTLWNGLSDDYKFPAMGGSAMAPVDGMPGEFDLTAEGAAESLDGMTHYPASQFDKLTGAATLIHMMNANTFTAAAYSFADAETTDAMVSVLKDAILGTQWMCGFPELLKIIEVSDNCLVVMFGAGDIVTPIAQNAVSLLNGTVVVEQNLWEE